MVLSLSYILDWGYSFISCKERLIFLPEKLPLDYSFEFDVPFEEHFIQMDDGARINALHFTQEQSKGLIIYFHGNAGSLARWGEIVTPFLDMGYEVLLTGLSRIWKK